MHGNAWEWCQDWNEYGYYAKSPLDDPGGPPTGSYRVVRGGWWGNPAWWCRSAVHISIAPENRYSDLGFRVARTR